MPKHYVTQGVSLIAEGQMSWHQDINPLHQDIFSLDAIILERSERHLTSVAS